MKYNLLLFTAVSKYDEVQIQSLSSPRDFCDGENGTKICLSSSTLVVFCQYYSYSGPYYFSHLPPTLYNISNRQRREITHLQKNRFWTWRKCDVLGHIVQYVPMKCQYENKNVIFIAEFSFSSSSSSSSSPPPPSRHSSSPPSYFLLLLFLLLLLHLFLLLLLLLFLLLLQSNANLHLLNGLLPDL